MSAAELRQGVQGTPGRAALGRCKATQGNRAEGEDSYWKRVIPLRQRYALPPPPKVEVQRHDKLGLRKLLGPDQIIIRQVILSRIFSCFIFRMGKAAERAKL